MKQLLTASVIAIAAIGITGCASEKAPGLAPVPEEIPGAPTLRSVPADTVRVGVIAGGGDMEKKLVKGQQFYLVDESTDTLLYSGVADRDGEVSVGEDGATFRGDEIWDGGDQVRANSTIGLYVSRQLQKR